MRGSGDMGVWVSFFSLKVISSAVLKEEQGFSTNLF